MLHELMERHCNSLTNFNNPLRFLGVEFKEFPFMFLGLRLSADCQLVCHDLIY